MRKGRQPFLRVSAPWLIDRMQCRRMSAGRGSNYIPILETAFSTS